MRNRSHSDAITVRHCRGRYRIGSSARPASTHDEQLGHTDRYESHLAMPADWNASISALQDSALHAKILERHAFSFHHLRLQHAKSHALEERARGDADVCSELDDTGAPGPRGNTI